MGLFLETGCLLLVALNLVYGAPRQLELFPTHADAHECGETLHVTHSVRIEYKLNQEHNSYELCPWILRFDGALSLRFDLLESGMAPSARVNIATLEANGQTPANPRFSSHDMYNGAFPVALPGTVAIVTFSSLNETGSGFVLNVRKVGESDTILAPDSVERIVAGGRGNLTHPENGTYANNELSAFIIAPNEYNSQCFGEGCTSVTFTEFDLEAGCFDRVNVFGFNRLMIGGWISRYVLCVSVPNTPMLLPGEMGLVVLTSDYAAPSPGFKAVFETSS